MPERSCIPQPKEPIKRIKGLPEDRQCLKFPGYQCNCPMSDRELRRATLKTLRQELGAYTLVNLFDTGVAEKYDIRRRQLCKGKSPKFVDRIKDLLRIRIV